MFTSCPSIDLFEGRYMPYRHSAAQFETLSSHKQAPTGTTMCPFHSVPSMACLQRLGPRLLRDGRRQDVRDV